MVNRRKHVLTAGKHSRMENGRYVRYSAGDVFVPTEIELQSFGERLRPVGAEPPTAEPPEPPEVVPFEDDAQPTEPENERSLAEALDKYGAPLDVTTGKPDVSLYAKKGGWYHLPGGIKVQGRAKAEAALLEAIRQE